MTSSELRMTMQLHKYNRLLQVDLYEVLLNYDLFIIVQLIYHLCGPVFVLAMHVELRYGWFLRWIKMSLPTIRQLYSTKFMPYPTTKKKSINYSANDVTVVTSM